MSIRDDLHKWANREWDRGNPVSIQEIAEQAERLHQQRTNSQFDATEKAIEASLAALAERNRAVADRDVAVQQAQIWKQEARTQAATVAEIYQLCTDSIGEPGDWHGTEPVRRALAVAERREKALAAYQADLVRELTACQSVLHQLARAGEVTPEYADDAKAVLKRSPEASLDKLKERLQAECISQIVKEAWKRREWQSLGSNPQEWAANHASLVGLSICPARPKGGGA